MARRRRTSAPIAGAGWTRLKRRSPPVTTAIVSDPAATRWAMRRARFVGISVIRHGDKSEETTRFSGYPAKQPWFPLASDIYQEIIPSIGDAYPYAATVLFIYMGSPVYALPAGHTNIAILSDPAKVPQHRRPAGEGRSTSRSRYPRQCRIACGSRHPEHDVERPERGQCGRL